MFVKNVTPWQFTPLVGEKRLSVMPNEVIEVDDSLRHFLDEVLASGSFVEVGVDDKKEHDDVVAQAKADKEVEPIPVVKVQPANREKTTVVNCAATMKNGKRCSGTVVVNFDEYEADKPYFCGRHKNESANMYERVNGDWAKKQS